MARHRSTSIYGPCTRTDALLGSRVAPCACHVPGRWTRQAGRRRKAKQPPALALAPAGARGTRSIGNGQGPVPPVRFMQRALSPWRQAGEAAARRTVSDSPRPGAVLVLGQQQDLRWCPARSTARAAALRPPAVPSLSNGRSPYPSSTRRLAQCDDDPAAGRRFSSVVVVRPRGSQVTSRMVRSLTSVTNHLQEPSSRLFYLWIRKVKTVA